MDKRSDDTDPQQAARRAGIELANQIYFSRQSERAEEAFALVENAQTEARALYLLGLFYYAGFGCQKEVSKSIHYHQQAAAAGEADAMFELYVFYIKGVGVPSQVVSARRSVGKLAGYGQLGRLLCHRRRSSAGSRAGRVLV